MPFVAERSEVSHWAQPSAHRSHTLRATWISRNTGLSPWGCLSVVVAAACVLVPRVTAAQGLTGTLIGTVSDEQGAAVVGAQARISSPALIGFDLTNARGRLPNDRPHALRLMGSVDVSRTGFVVAANLQHFSGKPWAATALVSLPQSGNQPTLRILLEPRGSRRLSSQTLLDVRLSRAISVGRMGRIEVIVDVLNALNDRAEEALTTDNLFNTNFGRPTVFMDPRRAMLSIRFNLGR